MMSDELVSLETAKLAKEKGFNWPCSSVKIETIEGSEREVYDEDECRYVTVKDVAKTRIPTQTQLQRWLREEKGYYVYPFFDNEELKWTYVVREKTGDMWIPLIGETPYYDCFEEAMEDALKFVLENLV